MSAETIDPAVRERVRRGAELLDRERPGWAEKVDPETLRLWSWSDCVLGRVYGSYGEGLDDLWPRPDGKGRPLGGGEHVPEAAAHGFSAHPDWHHSPLHAAWRAEIAARTAPEGVARG